MNHDEYMRRTLALLPFTAARAPAFEGIGRRYLAATRSQPSSTRIAALASYEDGGLQRVFSSMLTFAHWNNAVLLAFRHFLQEHVRFDSDSDAGHGALCRHIGVDDRALPLWSNFRDLLVEAVPAIRRSGRSNAA
jgi:hypothetical protein